MITRETITAKEAADYVGISYWKILELAKAGKIPHIRLQGRVLFRRHSLDEWMSQLEQNSVETELETVNGIRVLKA